jgi:hypothetical protein
MADYGHYMGLKFGVFWRNMQLKQLFSTRTEKKRFTGISVRGRDQKKDIGTLYGAGLDWVEQENKPESGKDSP